MATVNRALARHFALYRGDDLMGLAVNENHLVFAYQGKLPELGRILFSVTRRGQAALVHFASNNKALKAVKDACRQFMDFVVWLFPWCKMILACVTKNSVERLVKKLGYKPVTELTNGRLYAWAVLSMTS